jgi:1A family penicillin-binding protein
MPRIKSYRKIRRERRGLKKLFILFIWLCVLGFILIVGVFAYFAKDLPSPEQITERRMVESTKIYDRTGKFILYDVHGEEKRTVIPFEEIPQYVKDATLVIEDDNFYHHFGLDFRAIIRAFLANLGGQEIAQGGSTMTQQFIKNAILTPERTFTRKIKEAILAIEMEIKYSKDEIFSFYLNQVPYGSNAYGIEAAAQTFLNKNTKDLSIAESAFLAALPQAPSYYSPYGSHLDEVLVRQSYILERMKKFGYITEEEFIQAQEEELELAPVASSIKAPHFVMYVREYLEENYGKEYMEKAGLKVYTTLDWDFQQIAEKTVLEGVQSNIKNYNAHNAALVAIDPKTGQILAMVGSKDYWAEPYPENCIPGTIGKNSCRFEPNVNVVVSNRQPGSSFKPIAYATAFEKGFTPDTMIFDLKTEFAVEGAESYIPQNYDDRFRGPISFRQALAQSLNVPSVKVLYLAGLNDTLNNAQDMGIETLKDRSRFGLSLVLGGGEVKLLEETSAFGVFATEGIKHPTNFILKIEDSNGGILEEYKEESDRILGVQITRLISDILSDEQSRAPMFGSHSKLYLADRPAAAKTGTTQEYRDGWTIGYTPSLVAGVWAGNNDNTSMREGAGIYVAAPIWNEFMKLAYENKLNADDEDREQDNYFNLPEEPEEFTKPESIETDKDILNGKFTDEIRVYVNKENNKLATNSTPPELLEERIYHKAHCVLYYLNKNNPQASGDGKNDSQFNNWEGPVNNWAESMGYNQEPPTEYDD